MVENLEKKLAVKVIHSLPVWLPQTQTWMYNQINHLQRLGVESHVVCERTENVEQFVVANIHSLGNVSLHWQVWDKGLRSIRIRRHLNYLVDIGNKTGMQTPHSHFGNVGWANLGAVHKLQAKHVVTFYGLDVNKLLVQRPIWRRCYSRQFIEMLAIGMPMVATTQNLLRSYYEKIPLTTPANFRGHYHDDCA